MSRIPLAEKDSLSPEMQQFIDQVEEATGDNTAMRVLAYRPEMLRKFADFYWHLQTESLLDRKLIEMVRLAVAQINRCPSCLKGRYQDSFEQGLTEELIARLPDAEMSEGFTERERAAISFGQKMAADHWSVGDEDFERLFEHFTTEEVVELNMMVAQFIGIGRMFAAINSINPVCEIRLPQAAGA